MQEKLDKLLKTKVCLVDGRVDRVYDGILTKSGTIYSVSDECGFLSQFSISIVKFVKGRIILVN